MTDKVAINKRKKTLKQSELKVVHCPRCNETDLYTPDGVHVNCRACDGCWSMGAFFNILQEAKG